MRSLRRWQVECIEKALQHYQSNPHFFVQATPASGKTYLAAELARQLLDDQKIDLVVCFAPSREVVEGFNRTFSAVLGKRFGDVLGASGAAYTYQSMDYQRPEFWEIFKQARVLAVFDEIHHCAGHDPLLSNLWGQKILQHIQDDATYTLALSGTPWRTDVLPVALARYSDPEGQLVCDYCYDLKAAIQEGVCRSPRITLIDNPLIKLVEEQEANSSVRLFSGVTQLLGESPIRYEELLRHDDILEAVLDVGIQKLNEVRQSVSNAGGLVVVSDIEHAQQVSEILLRKGESVEVVNNQTPQARQRINHFRNSQTRWIVAVSMVSEGTDIPRLMVCCYLSRIRTELHYRQVLGRILRKMSQIDVEAWLYVIAEPTLRKFSARIADDLPHDRATLQTKKIDKRHHQAIESAHGKEGTPSEDGDAAVDPIAISRALLWDGASENNSDATIRTLSFSKYYRQYLLSLA